LPVPPRKEKPRPKVNPDEAGLIIIPTTSTPKIEVAAEVPVDEGAWSHVDSVMAELGRRADRYGVWIALRSDLSSLAALERTIAAAACPWFAVDFDPVAVLRDEWPMDEAFSRLGQWIKHVRVRDAVAGMDRRTRPAPVGQGSVDWEQVRGNLEELGYSGWAVVDPTELQDRLAGARIAKATFAP
jgi:sugar phosphate isomerase/epimerase